MKLAADVNEAVLSNVGTTGEFKIRNSAKAFKILSDGLYSNKIKAVIRELSCNAVDSHVAAGKKEVPFELHLPTVLEPWFAVTDFGIGLSGEDVINIYTTYFESTKTQSNDFIGALGLGSKSPFSYTENFTVTAIKDGYKRIYSAFINESGIPSVAEMGEQLTDENNGVEVKFSVTNRYDYQSFANEARNVLKWFKVKPIITGVDNFIIGEIEYKEKDIVPGVHILLNDNHRYNRSASIAIMGNISYPINISEPEKHFGTLSKLLNCCIVLECGIGELDFAASREELSYVSMTITSIKRKLTELNDNIVSHLAKKADAITCKWQKSFLLQEHYRDELYKAAVESYVAKTKFELFFKGRSHYGEDILPMSIKAMTDKGIKVMGFRSSVGRSTTIIQKYSTSVKDPVTGLYDYEYRIPVAPEVIFVLNDTKIGVISRSRYHYTKIYNKDAFVIILSHASDDMAVRQVAYDEILKDLHNPPNVTMGTTLTARPRTTPVSTSGITKLVHKESSSGRRQAEYIWKQDTDPIDENEVYYYTCLSGHKTLDKFGKDRNFIPMKEAMDQCGVSNISNIEVYGVRKNRIKEIQELDNWILIDEKLTEEVKKVSDSDVASMVVQHLLDSYTSRVYTSKTVAQLVGPTSDYAKYVAKYGGIKRSSGSTAQLEWLCKLFGKGIHADKVTADVTKTKADLYKKYPMLQYVNTSAKDGDVAEYIMMVDNS